MPKRKGRQRDNETTGLQDYGTKARGAKRKRKAGGQGLPLGAYRLGLAGEIDGAERNWSLMKV